LFRKGYLDIELFVYPWGLLVMSESLRDEIGSPVAVCSEHVAWLSAVPFSGLGDSKEGKEGNKKEVNNKIYVKKFKRKE